MHPCCYQGLFVRAEASKEAGYVVRPCSTHSKGAQSRLSVSAPLLPYQGTSSRGHALSLGEGAPPPPKDHTLSGPPSRQARRRSSERPRSVHRSGTGRGLLPVRPPPQPNRVTAAIVIPVMNAAMQVNTNTLSRRLAFMAFLPNRGTPRIPQEGTGILVPRYRAAAGDFFQ